MKEYENSKKKQDTYTYVWADGTRTTLVAGQDGVTEAFISLLHEMDNESINAERREKRKAPQYIEDVLKEGLANDKNNLLRDSRYDPAEMLYAKVDAKERERQLVKLQEALKVLSRKQGETIEKLFFGEHAKKLTEIADEEGIRVVTVFDRREAAFIKLKNFLENCDFEG